MEDDRSGCRRGSSEVQGAPPAQPADLLNQGMQDTVRDSPVPGMVRRLPAAGQHEECSLPLGCLHACSDPPRLRDCMPNLAPHRLTAEPSAVCACALPDSLRHQACPSVKCADLRCRSSRCCHSASLAQGAT